jgi:hypothetical protein
METAVFPLGGRGVALFRKKPEPAADAPAGTVLADQAYRCNLCLEAIATGEPMFRCSCAQLFHSSCTPGAVSCPKCGSPIRAPMPEMKRTREPESPSVPKIERVRPEPHQPTSFSDAVEAARKVWKATPDETASPKDPSDFPAFPSSSPSASSSSHTVAEVEDIYLIHRKSGLLIQRRTWRREPVDADIMTGMLDSIRDFISQSFTRGETQEFSRFQQGEHEILVMDGRLVSLAITIAGEAADALGKNLERAKEEMRAAVTGIEEAHAPSLEKWKGDVDVLRGARRPIDRVATRISKIIERGHKESARPAAGERKFTPGLNYLILDGGPARSYEALSSLIRSGRPGLVISTTLPSKLRRQYGIDGSDILWLTEAEGPGVVRPERLEFEIQRIVSAFFREHPDGVFLLDGIEFLIVSNGHERVVKFAKRVADLAGAGGGTFLVPLNPGPIPADPLGVLRRTFDRVEEGR